MLFETRLIAQPINRPWLIKRVAGSYDQHAHMKSKEDCENVIRLMKANKLPDFKNKEINKDYKIAMERLMTPKEFKRLRKKDRYININKGGVR